MLSVIMITGKQNIYDNMDIYDYMELKTVMVL